MNISTNKLEIEINQEIFRKDFLKNKRFHDNFIITRDYENNPLSYFKDDNWDLSSYRLVPKDRGIIDFTKIYNIDRRNEAKRLMLLIMIYKRGVNGNMLSNSTLIENYFNGVIMLLANYSKENNISIKQLLENSIKLSYFIKEKVSIAQYNVFKSFLTFLYKTSNDLTNIDYKKNEGLTKYLKIKHAQYRKSRDQVEVIPTRIFNKIIQEKLAFIDEINDVLDDLIDFIDNILFDKYKNISQSVTSEKLRNIFSCYDVKSKLNFCLFFRRIQEAVKLLIHAYTGMRNSEVNSLYTNCFEYHENKEKNLKYFTIAGYGTKLKGKKIEKWVTSKKIEMPIYILSKLNLHVLNYKYGNKYDLSNSPLFIVRNLLVKNTKEILETNLMCNIESLNSFPSKEIIISEADILELEAIEPFRDWRGDPEFNIGTNWKIKSHQFRRTLVVYAIQSGLVSLGGLQIQLKHLIRDMTLYYGNGATFAKELFNISPDHIGKDMNEAKNEFNMLSYVKNVILSKEKLFAAHGNFVEKNIKNKDTTLSEYLLNNKKNTLQMFKNGEIMYTETAMGGCISIEPCNYRLARILSSCIECTGAVLKETKLDKVIYEQKKFIQTLKLDSIEYRTEKKELEKLINYKKKMIGEKNE